MADGTRVTINKLNNDNYETWKFKMELLLIKEGLQNSASKETPIQLDQSNSINLEKPRRTSESDDKVARRRRTAHEAKTVKQMWNALQNYYRKGSLSDKVFILKKLCNMKLAENVNMEEHIQKISAVNDKLKTAGEEIKENLFIARLLCRQHYGQNYVFEH